MSAKKSITKETPECFVIMPISDREPYKKGHFMKIYRNIFTPAIEKAGYKPYRADDGKDSGEITIDILTKLIEAPLAICDLSSLNPNVMYELGMRQAFDKPVVFIAEEGTKIPFDISTIRTVFYRNNNDFNEVPEDIEKIKEAIESTVESKSSSLIKLLGLNATATIEKIEGDEEGNALLLLREEMKEMKKMISNKDFPVMTFENEKLLMRLDEFEDSRLIDITHSFIANLNSMTYELPNGYIVSRDIKTITVFKKLLKIRLTKEISKENRSDMIELLSIVDSVIEFPKLYHFDR